MLNATETLRFSAAAYCTSCVELEGFPRRGKQLVHHALEVADGEHPVNHAAIFSVDHHFVDLARILILTIDHRPRSECLNAPSSRPVVSASAAEEQK